jgi:integrase
MARYIRFCRELPDPQEGNFQLIQLYTGMRREEVRNLKWADVDLERGANVMSRIVAATDGGMKEKAE